MQGFKEANNQPDKTIDRLTELRITAWPYKPFAITSARLEGLQWTASSKHEAVGNTG